MSRLDHAIATIADHVGATVSCLQTLDSMSNNAFLIQIGQRRAVLRLHSALYDAPVIDHAREIAIHELTAEVGLSPAIVFSDIETGVLVTDYVAAGVFDETAVRQPAALSAIAHSLKRLHAVELPDALTGYSLTDAADLYLRRAGKTNNRKYCALAARVRDNESATDNEMVLCHRDLLCSNILRSDPVQLIDWEFASPGERWFDLAAVIGWHQFDQAATNVLVSQYLGRDADAQEQRKLQRAIESFSALCELWSLPAVH